MEIGEQEINNQILNYSKLENEKNKLNNNIKVENNLKNYVITSEIQKNFLDTTIGRTINSVLNIGLKALLPDLIENQVIDVKDTIIKYGFKEGLSKTIDSAIDLGKSVIGIATGKFENITQVENAVQKGGIIDITSNAIDTALKYANKSGILPKQITQVIKKGKNVIIDNLSNNLEKVLTSQVKSIENINRYADNWNIYYEKQDFKEMDKEYKKIIKELDNIIPLENTLKQARQIENIHLLIKNNGQNFNLSKEQIELSKKLVQI